MEKKIEIEHFKSLDSTSSFLERELAQNPDMPQWRVCNADYQSAGRGQRGNRWESRGGENLTFSIFLRPDFIEVNRQFLLVEIFALAVKRFLENFGVHSRIKWPNDIYVANRKICGMLFENSISASHFSTSIVGIGLNLNQVEFGPGAINPTSVALETGTPANRDEALRSLLEICFRLYDGAASGRITPEEVTSEYLRSLYRYGELHRFQRLAAGTAPLNVTYEKDALKHSGGIFSAKVSGVTPEGLLELENTDGSVETFGFKEIRFLI